MWPNVLNDIKEQIIERLTAAGETADVYLGASGVVPSKKQINIIRSTMKLAADERYCEQCEDDELTVYIEIWAYEDAEPEGDTDVDYENSRTLATYDRLAKLTTAIRASEFESIELGYSSEYQRTEGDNDEFRPTCGQRIEYLIELGGS